MSRRPSAAGLVLLTLVAAACGSSAAPSGSLSGPAIVVEKARGASLLPTDRFALPTFDYGRFQQLMNQLADRGVPVVANIWASWCGPCKIESPNLVRAAKRFGSEVQFVGIDILDQRMAAQAFIKQEGYPYPSVFDPTGSIRDGLGYFGQPDTIFFDAGGHKVSSWSGPIGYQQLVSGIRKITS